MQDSKTRRDELKFVLLSVIVFGCFSIYPKYLFLVGMGVLIFAVLALGNLRKHESLATSSQPATYAGFWVRLGSLVVDYGFYSLFSIILHFLFPPNSSQPLITGGFYLGELAIVLYMVKRWGQSPGKMAMGIKIVKTDLTPLGWKEVFLRDWNGIFSGLLYFTKYLLIFLGILTANLIFTGAVDPTAFSSQLAKILHDKSLAFSGFWIFSEPFVLLTNPQNRALHDYLAGTIVISEQEKKSQNIQGPLLLLSIMVTSLSIYFLHQDQFKINQIEAQKGSAYSQRVLAMDYYTGFGVPKSYPDALNWFQKAASGGDAMAQEHLGLMYENGYAVKADRDEAIKWYRLAWKNGYYRAKKDLIRLGVEVE